MAQVVKIHLQWGRPGFDPWVGKIPLEKGMATHLSILAWEIPWTEEPGQLQSMGSQRADVTEHARMLTHTVTYTHERKE